MNGMGNFGAKYINFGGLGLPEFAPNYTETRNSIMSLINKRKIEVHKSLTS